MHPTFGDHLSNHVRPARDLAVIGQRERGTAAGVMAVLAVLLQQLLDIFVKVQLEGLRVSLRSPVEAKRTTQRIGLGRRDGRLRENTGNPLREPARPHNILNHGEAYSNSLRLWTHNKIGHRKVRSARQSRHPTKRVR